MLISHTFLAQKWTHLSICTCIRVGRLCPGFCNPLNPPFEVFSIPLWFPRTLQVAEPSFWSSLATLHSVDPTYKLRALLVLSQNSWPSRALTPDDEDSYHGTWEYFLRNLASAQTCRLTSLLTVTRKPKSDTIYAKPPLMIVIDSGSQLCLHQATLLVPFRKSLP